MKKSLFAALLCMFLITALIPGSVWSAPAPDADDPDTEPKVHIHAEHLYYIPYSRPTCMSEGNSSYYICECGLWFSDAGASHMILDHSSVILPKSAHLPEIVMDVPATCTKEGHSAGFLCSVCGEPADGYSAPETIPPKGHTPAGSLSSDSGGHWHACTVCGEPVDYEAHVSDGTTDRTQDEVCTVCGYVIRRGSAPIPNTPTVHPTPRPTPTPAPTPTPVPEDEAPEVSQTLVTRICFLDTGDTQIRDIKETRTDAQAESCTVQLPRQLPESAGWYFEGWRCSADGALYQPGSEFTFRWDGASQIDMTAEWTVLIGRGNYDLTAGMRYRFGEGSFLIDGDSTVYYGGSAFYVRENGNYTIR